MKNSEELLPGRARSYTEAHVALLGQRIIPQLFQVLGPQVLVRVPSHCILTCKVGGVEAGGKHPQVRLQIYK